MTPPQDWRMPLAKAIEDAMIEAGLTKEQMADVLRKIALNLTSQAARDD